MCETIYVTGDVDERYAGELSDVLDCALSASTAITIDLTRCRYIASAGLRVLLRAQRRAQRFTTLVEAGSITARVLRIAKVEERLGVRELTPVLAGATRPDDPRDFVRIIALEGEWDLSRGHELRNRLEAAVEHPRVVIDLSQASFIDTHCAGMLVRARTQRVAKGYEAERLVVRAANVLGVLGVIGAHSLWRICESVEDAVRGWKHPGNIPAADAT